MTFFIFTMKELCKNKKFKIGVRWANLKLFNDALSTADTGLFASIENERLLCIWKDWKINRRGLLQSNTPRNTEKNHERHVRIVAIPVEIQNWHPPEYKSETLSLGSTWSIERLKLEKRK